MLILRYVVWMLSIGPLVLGWGIVFGQQYPNKPIHVFTGGAGGGSDITVRLIASSPEQFASAIKIEMTRLGKLIRDANIRAE